MKHYSQFVRGCIAGLFVFVFSSSLVLAEDRRPNKSSLIVMSLNAEFMWDGVDPEEGRVDFSRKGSPDDAEEHMEKISM